MRDDKLLQLIEKDPEAGMKHLTDRYAGLVFSVVRGKMQGFCDADIEACVSDVFGDFYLGRGRIDPQRGNIKAWLCVIAKRKAIDCLRARAKECGNVSLDDEQTAVQATDTFSVEGDFEDREQRTALLQAIRDLGEPDHEILIRKFYLLQPSKVIAEKMGMSVSAVDTRTHRAIAKLRDMLGG